MQLQERDIRSNYNELLKVFNIISLSGKYKIIGSSNLKNFRYNSDFDLAEFYENKDIDAVVKYFQYIYNTLDSPKSYCYITDFKCGLNIDNSPLKWTKNEVLKNKKKLNNNKFITLQEAISQKSTIKIDVVCFINNTFVEISENYYIRAGDESNYNSKEETNKQLIIKSIKNSEKQEVMDNNYNKALKRLFSYKLIENKNSSLLKKLVEFFNSSVGILNKSRSDLDVLILLIDKNIKAKTEHIKQALDNIKYNISFNTIKEYVNNFVKLEKIKNKEKLKQEMILLRDDIFNIVNIESKKYYRKIK